jgi:hypothetical protein
MKFKLFIVSFFSFFSVVAQQKQHKRNLDSLDFFRNEAIQFQKMYFDSMSKTSEYKALIDGFERNKGYLERNFSFDGFIDFTNSNLVELNQILQKSGYDNMSNFGVRLGFGMTFVKDKRVLNMNFFSIGLSKRSTKDQNIITLDNMDFFQFNLGYKLLKNKSFSIYPYFGPSVRISSLNFYSPSILKEKLDNIEEFVVKDQSFTLSRTNLNFRYGLALDLKLHENKNKTKNKTLFIKGEGNSILGNSSHGNKSKINLNIVEANWLITAGLRFVTEN